MTESDKQTGRHAKSVSLIYTRLPWDAGHSTSSPQRLVTYMVHGGGETSLFLVRPSVFSSTFVHVEQFRHGKPSSITCEAQMIRLRGRNHMAELLGCSLTSITLHLFKDFFVCFWRILSNLSAAAGQRTTTERLQLNRVTGGSN